MTPQRLPRPLAFLFSASLALVGCDSDSEEPTDDGAATEDDGADDEPATDEGEDESGGAAAGFAADIAPILAANCSCHASAMPAAGLDLNAAAAYDSLVGVASSVGAPYVTEGDSSASYLVNKLDGSQAGAGGGGAQMPLGGSLDAASVDEIVAWIDAGALP